MSTTRRVDSIAVKSLPLAERKKLALELERDRREEQWMFRMCVCGGLKSGKSTVLKQLSNVLGSGLHYMVPNDLSKQLIARCIRGACALVIRCNEEMRIELEIEDEGDEKKREEVESERSDDVIELLAEESLASLRTVLRSSTSVDDDDDGELDHDTTALVVAVCNAEIK